MSVAELTPMLIDAAHALDNSLVELESQVKRWATAERDYRAAKSAAYLQADGSTVAEREANAEPLLSSLRYARDMAEGLKVSALEGVRSRRTQVSAIQTLASLAREEAAFARTGPEFMP